MIADREITAVTNLGICGVSRATKNRNIVTYGKIDRGVRVRINDRFRICSYMADLRIVESVAVAT